MKIICLTRKKTQNIYKTKHDRKKEKLESKEVLKNSRNRFLEIIAVNTKALNEIIKEVELERKNAENKENMIKKVCAEKQNNQKKDEESEKRICHPILNRWIQL